MRSQFTHISIGMIAALLWLQSAFSFQSQQPIEVKLEEFRNRELSYLSEQQRLRLNEALSKIKGVHLSKEARDYSPISLWNWNSLGINYVLIESPGLFIIPSARMVRIQLLSEAECRAMHEIQVGWRKHIGWTTIRKLSDDYPYPIIEVNLIEYDGTGRDRGSIAREYFAVTMNDVKLLRIENFSGELIRNQYAYPNWTVGIWNKTWTESEILHVLDSKDKATLLDVLVWIGGVHSTSIEKPTILGMEIYAESGDQVSLIRRIRGNRDVKSKLKKLAQSDDRWIREAATNALNPNDDDD